MGVVWGLCLLFNFYGYMSFESFESFSVIGTNY